MFRHILAFELRQQFGNPVLWVVALVFALLAFGATSSDAVQVGGAIGNVHRNAPITLVTMLTVFSALSMLLVTIFVAGGALRDFDNRTAELFFATPVHKRDYLLGRFGGGLLASVAVMLVVAAAMLLGTLMPWLDPARLGPTTLTPYLWGMGVLVLPNLVFVAALLFCIAVATRSMLSTYIGVIAFFAVSMITGTLTGDLDAKWVAVLLDPFGGEAISVLTRYWSVAELNSQLPELSGMLLANRALWLGVAVVLLALTWSLFRTDREGLQLRRRKARPALAAAAPAPVLLPKVALAQGASAHLRQFLHQAWFDARGVLRGVPLLVMLAIGMFILVTNLVYGDQMYGTTIYPTTIRMTQAIEGSFSLFLIIIVTFYAGELVWRERAQRIAEVTDAFPNPDWVPLLAKVAALSLVVFAFYATGALVAMANQLLRGFTALEPLLYLKQMLLVCVPFALLGVLALFLQVLSNNKFVGYLLMLVFLLSRVVLGILEFDDNLFRPFGAPSAPYSAMNGFGHFLAARLWFQAYWGLFATLLLIGALLLWVRGGRSTLAERRREAGRRFSPPLRLATALSAVGFLGLGGWIYYNTHVLNRYEAGDAAMDRAADYEKQYRQYKDLPQPRITAMRTEVDIEPYQRRVEIRGHYRLVNPHPTPVAELHVDIDPEMLVGPLQFGAHTVVASDAVHGYTIYRLEQPLAPGAEMDFDFTITFAPEGFRNDTGPTQVVWNGTFFNSSVLPSFGYDEGRQLMDRNERRKRDLGEVPRIAGIDDMAARSNTYLGDDADWLQFETIVSTAADQTALAPGYLQREWTENGRRYFHYRMDRPMLAFAAWLSARWEVRRDEWNGIPIEVYYDPKHPYNVERMIEASKKSLDYYSREFTPYQHRQVRILEFPGYSSFAQSFANTIPYSESIGFIADLRDPEDIDYVFYITAHEIAHQWWAHQVIGGNVQGATVLSESLSQYSALMVMEEEYGPEKMRKFLKYELDTYLGNRSGELREELPLALVENQQYIHYRKGSLVFYALKEAIGEDVLNGALKRFLQDKGYQQAPFTTSRELLAYIRDAAPGSDALIDDLFEKIVFHDNRTTAASAVQRADGKWVVTLELHAAKLQADGEGVETPLPLEASVEVGVFSRPAGGSEADERVLHLQRHPLTGATTTLELVVDEMPYEAGIDPYNKLIDRVSDDDRRRVDL